MTRVLSIQSHVVSGYVGNRAATFPMQYLGLDVDVINTVQLSNHTGYEKIKGKVFDADHILELYEGLELNGLDSYDFLLSGYMGNAKNIEAVREIAKKLAAKNDRFFFLLDPVLGDYGKLYVDESLIDLYRKQLIPLANLVTPNQFEAELVSGKPIKTLEDAKNACLSFHDLGTPNVIITSTVLDGDETQLHLIGSQFDATSKKHSIFSITFPMLPGYYTGAGDLLCALVLSNIANSNESSEGPVLPFGSLKRICEVSLASQFHIIHATMEHQRLSGIPAPPGLDQSQMTSKLVKSFELTLVPNRKFLSDPTVVYTANDISY
ncbi:Pyridoxal kinase [Smittium mucronatum]|uniref:pyridoxal kinase n=1 Tax=Smittium mucronatum TaxID=133383 RepID=A0A1R0H508_9FUNG|nr:Pyridoxal kinase [Smittium mucronatum]